MGLLLRLLQIEKDRTCTTPKANRNLGLAITLPIQEAHPRITIMVSDRTARKAICNSGLAIAHPTHPDRHKDLLITRAPLIIQAVKIIIEIQMLTVAVIHQVPVMHTDTTMGPRLFHAAELHLKFLINPHRTSAKCWIPTRTRTDFFEKMVKGGIQTLRANGIGFSNG